jgi:NhaA family Na+:H+ antiporter
VPASGTDGERALRLRQLTDAGASPMIRCEHRLQVSVSVLVLAIFALLNAGVELGGSALLGVVVAPVGLAVLLGLLLGKPIGVVVGGLIVRTLTKRRSPVQLDGPSLLVLGVIAGIASPSPSSVAGLAFSDAQEVEQAKVAILAASTLAASAGGGALALSGRRSMQSSPRR